MTKEEVKNILMNNNFPLVILNNPFFIDYLLAKFKEGYILRNDNNFFYLKKNIDYYRNTGKRAASEIRFKTGKIIDRNSFIYGVFTEEINEAREGNFATLVVPKWKYKDTLVGRISFYDTEGVLMQKQEIKIERDLEYQNDKFGIEAYNSKMRPYDYFFDIAFYNNYGLIDIHPLFSKYTKTYFYKRHPEDPDKLMYKEYLHSRLLKELIVNNGDSLYNLNNSFISKYQYMGYERKRKEEVMKKCEYSDNLSDEKKLIYSSLIRRIELAY